MKRLVSFLLIFVVLFSSYSIAATKQDLINAINASYYVSEKEPNFTLPKKYRDKGVAYVLSHDLTDEQCAKILSCINSAVAFAQEIGHTKYKTYTEEQKARGLAIILEACRAAGVNDINEAIKEATQPTPSTTESNVQSESMKTKTEDEGTKTNVSISKDNSGDTIDEKLINSSGESTINSDEVLAITEDFLSGDTISSLLSEFDFDTVDYSGVVNRNMTIAYVLITIIFIIIILLIRLIFMKKWNKIVKAILIIPLVIIAIAILVVVGFSLYYFNEIKMLYELYYLLK